MDKRDRPYVVVVILNYNCAPLTVECVSSVFSCEESSLKVIVVDNCSTDSSVEILRNKLGDNTDLELVALDRNGGFSEGCNVGIIKALSMGAEWIHLLNPDTVLDPGFYSRLRELDSRHPDVGAVGGLGLFMDEKDKVWFGGGVFNWIKGRGECLYQGEMLDRIDFETKESEFLTCACLVVRAGVVKDVGLLDARYFLGGEEWDYSLRISLAGYGKLIDKKMKYWHHVSGSLERKVSPKYIYNGYRTKILFVRDYRPLFFYLWLPFYYIHTRLFSSPRFKKLDPTVSSKDVKHAIVEAEKDSAVYKTIEFSHLRKFE